jgi:hypothetical protein
LLPSAGAVLLLLLPLLPQAEPLVGAHIHRLPPNWQQLQKQQQLL